MTNSKLSSPGQAVIGTISLGLHYSSASLGAGPIIQGIFAGGAFIAFVGTCHSLWKTWKQDRMLDSINLPVGIYGKAYDPTAEDAKKFGLSFNNPSGKGYLVGGKDGQLLYYVGDSHSVILGANGSGKSKSFSIPIGLSLAENMIFTGKGLEVAEITRNYRKDVFGHEIRVVNSYQMEGIASDNVNLLADLFEYIERDDPEALDIASSKAQLLIPTQKKGGGGEPPFFPDFARAFLGPAMNFAVWLEVETGQLTGNLPYLHDKLCNSTEVLRQFQLEMSQCDALDGSVAKAAKRFSSLLDGSPKTALSVLGVLSNALASFDPASLLGKNIIQSDFDVLDIKRKPMTIYIAIPPDKVQTSVFAGLLIEMFIGISLRTQGKGRALYFNLDEFGNLARGEIPNIIPMLYLGRSLKTRGIFMVQDTSIFERYEESSAFTTQAQCYIATAVRSTKDAEELSKRAGQYSEIVESTNLPIDAEQNIDGSYSVNLSEKAIPNKRADEILQLKDYTGLLYFKQNPPITIDLVHYQSVQEWRDYAENNPDIELEDIPVKYSLKP